MPGFWEHLPHHPSLGFSTETPRRRESKPLPPWVQTPSCAASPNRWGQDFIPNFVSLGGFQTSPTNMGYTTPYHNPKYEILQKKTIHLRLIPCSMLSLSWPHWDHLPRCGTGTPKDTVRAAKNIAWTDEKTMKRGTVAYQEEEQPHVGIFSQEWRCCLVCLYLIPQWLAGLEQYHCNVQTGWTNRVLDGLSNVCLCDSPNVERSFTFVSKTESQ